jgi:two-component system cell cycle response regulator
LGEQTERLSTFVWSLYLIPNILIMNKYPKWKVIIGTAIFYSLLKYTSHFFEDHFADKLEMNILIIGSFVNGLILFTVSYFQLKYKKLLKQVQKLTIIDPLTGLYNRRYFDLYMEKAIPLSQRNSLVLIILDIDDFKKINDKYGHLGGDEALKHMSKMIKSCVRKSDGYVRFGGEEFAIILPNTDLTKGRIFAERIRAAVDQSEFPYKNDFIHFTISIGVTMYDGENVEEFIENADKALYRAKENGRNQVVVF